MFKKIFSPIEVKREMAQIFGRGNFLAKTSMIKTAKKQPAIMQVNSDIVLRRQGMWYYISQLKSDKFMKKYVLW